jgi:hypothetical protein
LAFTDDGYPSNSAICPLTAERKKQYPEVSDSMEALSDLQAGIETPVTDAFKERLAKMSSDDVKSLFERESFFGGVVVHGTHVAGIALSGNPAARLVVFRFNDNLSRELHFPPTTEYAHRMAANFKLIGEFCAQHKVRVVNLSWGDQPSEFEEWLSITKANQTPEERKQEALALFAIWKQAIIDAMQAAPGKLRVHRSQAARRVEIQPLGRGNRPKTTPRRAVKTLTCGQKPGPALVSRTSRAASMLGVIVGP